MYTCKQKNKPDRICAKILCCRPPVASACYDAANNALWAVSAREAHTVTRFANHGPSMPLDPATAPPAAGVEGEGVLAALPSLPRLTRPLDVARFVAAHVSRALLHAPLLRPERHPALVAKAAERMLSHQV